MKVLHIGKYYYPYSGGMETYLYNLCTELARSVEIEVLVANTERTTVEENVEGIHVTRVGRIVNIASTDICPTFVSHLAKRSPDIIHLHCPNPMAVASFFLSGNVKSKLIITYHNDIIRQRILLNIYRPLLSRLLNRAERILVHAETYAHNSPMLQPHLHKVTIAPPGINTKHFEVTPEINVRVNEINQRYGKKIVLFIGRLVYYKGIEYLIRAMNPVSAHLIIIGSGPLKRKLMHMCTRAQLQDKVSFISYVDEREKVAFLHASSLLCLPSIMRSETFGIVQLEGMICGKPVVNTHIEGSSVSSVSKNNETGITVPIRDSPALSKAINFLLDNHTKRDEFGKNGVKRVLHNFTREHAASKVLGIYNELMVAKAHIT